MNYRITTKIEALMNGYTQGLENEGLIGFCIGDISDDYLTIRHACFSQNNYLSIIRKDPGWEKMNKFLRENRENGSILPWLLSLSPKKEKMKGFKPLIELAGNKEAVLSIPKLRSVFMYQTADNELYSPELTDTIPFSSGFTEEFGKIYDELSPLSILRVAIIE